VKVLFIGIVLGMVLAVAIASGIEIWQEAGR